jgi:hypothetical protein
MIQLAIMDLFQQLETKKQTEASNLFKYQVQMKCMYINTSENNQEHHQEHYQENQVNQVDFMNVSFPQEAIEKYQQTLQETKTDYVPKDFIVEFKVEMSNTKEIGRALFIDVHGR